MRYWSTIRIVCCVPSLVFAVPVHAIDVVDTYDRPDDTEMCCTEVGDFQYIESGTVTGLGDTAEVFDSQAIVFGAEGLTASGPGLALIDVNLADVSVAADFRFDTLQDPFNSGTNNVGGYVLRRATADGAFGVENEGQVEVTMFPGGGFFIREIHGGQLNVLLHDNPFGGSVDQFYGNPGELPSRINGMPFDADGDGILEEDEPFRLSADLIGDQLTVSINEQNVANVTVSRSVPVGPDSLVGLYKNRFTGAGGLDPFNAAFDNLTISGTEFVPPPPPPIRHEGDNDPIDESWSPFNGGAPIANNGPVDDGGIPAWNIEDDSDVGGSRESYTRDLTGSQLDQLAVDGWTMKGSLKFLGTNDSPDGAVELSVFADSEVGYVLWFGADEDGNPILAEFSGSQLDGTIGIGRTATVEGTGYHDYEMAYDPVSESVDVSADGQVVIADMDPLVLDSGPTVLNRILWGSNDSSGMGNANYRFVEFVIGADSILGDFNNDGILDATDIDLLSAAVKANSDDTQFDVNLDGLIDQADRTTWIKDLKRTWIGDADLSGEFDSGDLVAIFAAGRFETGEMAGWAQGDWDGDMFFNSSDLVAAFADGGYEQGPLRADTAVPEPNGLLLLLLAMAPAGAVLRGS